MAFNPRDSKPTKVDRPDISTTGKPGRILTQLQRIEGEVKGELSYRGKPTLKTPPPITKPLGERRKYYIEWWKIGTDNALIESGEFHTANIKNFARKFLATGKYTLVYLRREVDGKVLQDRRSTLRR